METPEILGSPTVHLPPEIFQCKQNAFYCFLRFNRVVTGNCTPVADLPTLPCQIESSQVLLVLMVAYPRGFLIWMASSIFDPSGFYLDCGFSKVPGD